VWSKSAGTGGEPTVVVPSGLVRAHCKKCTVRLVSPPWPVLPGPVRAHRVAVVLLTA